MIVGKMKGAEEKSQRGYDLKGHEVYCCYASLDCNVDCNQMNEVG